MKIALLGYGKMGKTIERLALEKGHEIVFKSTSTHEEGNLQQADVAIEFSLPEVVVSNLIHCFENEIPVVCGTTGWLDHYDEIIKICEDRNGTFLYASNFSIGVNLFFGLNSYLAKLMSSWKDYQPSIEEIHHTQKLDAPSGTAITVAEGILEHSNKSNWKLDTDDASELNIHSIREGDVKGTHSVTYTSEVDSILIKHEAHTRDGFAMGAILAAEWLQDKKGVHTMQEVLQMK